MITNTLSDKKQFEYFAELQRSKYVHYLHNHYQKSEIIPQRLLPGSTFVATQEYLLHVEVLKVNHFLFVASESYTLGH